MVNCAQLLFVFLISLGNFILVSKAKNLSIYYFATFSLLSSSDLNIVNFSRRIAA